MGTILDTIKSTMASVSFFLRGRNIDKESTIYIRFRDKSVDVALPCPNLTCKPKDWKDGKCKSVSKRMRSSDEDTINVKLIKLEAFILERFKEEQPEFDIKKWLKLKLSSNKADNPEFKTDVISFFDFFIEKKAKEVSVGTIRDYKKKKNRLKEFISYKNKIDKTFTTLKFINLDNNFRLEFEKYYVDVHKGDIATGMKVLKSLKTVCKSAELFDIEVHKHALSWEFDFEKVNRNKPKSIYLSFAELDKIRELDLSLEHLDNARDWLLIACFTGQRVSDYLRFTAEMIVCDEEGRRYIEFKQQKTGKEMRIPILKEVEKVLEKNKGEFPYAISDVKLNLYIKQVCKKAEINHRMRGSISAVIGSDENGKKIIRKVIGEYPKWQLVTSHIGRKSFATNFYSKIPIGTLMFFTGHTSQQQLLEYISNTDNEQAESTAEIFAKLDY